MQKTAENIEAKYGVKIAESPGKNFYLDNLLKSVSNEGTVIKLM